MASKKAKILEKYNIIYYNVVYTVYYNNINCINILCVI